MQVELFNKLTLPQQCYYTTKKGVYLATFHDPDVSIDLFEVDGFYAEVFYMNGSIDCCMVKAYGHTACLNKYLSQISIAELF